MSARIFVGISTGNIGSIINDKVFLGGQTGRVTLHFKVTDIDIISSDHCILRTVRIKAIVNNQVAIATQSDVSINIPTATNSLDSH